MFTSIAVVQQEGLFFKQRGEGKNLILKSSRIRRCKFMDACKSSEEHFDLRLSQLKVQLSTVGLETSIGFSPTFASFQRRMSLVLKYLFARTVLYPSKRKP